MKKEIHITEDNELKRLDLFLAETFRHIPRNQWQNRIKQGAVLVNNRRVKSSYIVKKNDTVTFFYQAKPERKKNISVKILYEDGDLLVVDKPADIPVHPSGNYKTYTLQTYLKERYSYTYCHPINRLDRETSGIVLFGKNPGIIRAIKELFDDNRVKKIYRTLVFNRYRHPEILEGYIGKDFLSPVYLKHRFLSGEDLHRFLKLYRNDYKKNCDSFSFFTGDQTYIYRFARTGVYSEKVKPVSHPQYQEISLLRVHLYTGRTHQIRATLHYSGYPVIGDKIYGISENFFLKFLKDELSEEEEKLLLLKRTALHCSLLSFPHPYSGEMLEFSSELPEDFQSLL